jgi:hypothetical protein
VVAVLDAKGVMEPYEEPRQARGWLILLLGIVVFAAFGVVVGYAYFKGLPGIEGEPPLIKAEAGAYRLAPSERGGLEVSNANSSIVTVLRQQSETPRVERLLPPEPAAPLEATEPDTALGDPAPADQPVMAPDAVDGVETGPLGADATEAPSAPPGLPIPASKPAGPPVQLAATEPPSTIGALPGGMPEVAATAEPAPAPPTPAAGELVPRQARPDPPRPSVEASALPARPATAVPEPGAGPTRLVRVEPATQQAAPAPPARTAAPTSPAIAPSPRTAVGSGIYRLQLAAVRSENGLTQAWADLRQRYPGALATVNPQVERTDTSSGPLFRLQAGPFNNREAAANACGSIRASGGQCFIVGPITQ